MKIRINKEKIFFFFVLIFFMYPDGLKYIDGLDGIFSVFAVGRYIVSIIFIFVIHQRKIKKNYRKISFLILAFSVFLVLSSICNKTAKLTLGLSFMTIYGFFCFNLFYLSKDSHRSKLLSVYRGYIATLLICQLFTIILFPNGILLERIGVIQFLGGKNGVSLYALLLLEVLIALGEKNKKIFVVSFVLLIFMLINDTFSGFGAMLMVVMYLVISMMKNYKIFAFIKKNSLKLLLILLFLFFFGIVLGGQNNAFISGITALIGKDFTFSGRRAIWNAAINYIYNNPVWGIGQGVLYDVWNNGKYVYSAHNTFLDVAVAYGLVCFSVFVSTLVYIIKCNLKRDEMTYNNINFVIILATVLVMMFEALEMDYKLWAIFIISLFYLNNFDLVGMEKKK